MSIYVPYHNYSFILGNYYLYIPCLYLSLKNLIVFSSKKELLYKNYLLYKSSFFICFFTFNIYFNFEFFYVFLHNNTNFSILKENFCGLTIFSCMVLPIFIDCLIYFVFNIQNQPLVKPY